MNKFKAVVGRRKSMTPQQLLNGACNYFQWADENPLMKIEPIKSGPLAGTCVEVPQTRPYTIIGLCTFLGITQRTFNNYTKGRGYDSFFPVSEHIRATIFIQKFEGAVVGIFSANIIARDLNLANKKSTRLVSGNVSVLKSSKTDSENIEKMSPDEAYRLYKESLDPKIINTGLRQ